MKRISELEHEYIKDVLSNEFSTSKNGIYNVKLEEAFKSLFNVKFAINHTNGTATLHTALSALGIGVGDEVIVPPLTMSSTALAVLQNNSIPIFADVDIDTFNISVNAIEKCITSRTKAIISVSLYGLPPDYDELILLCNKYNLFLIEDNAESFLSTYKNKLVGLFGDFSSFSFQASKHLTAGEGGVLLCNDKEFANEARRFNSLGYAGVSAEKGKITKNDIQDPKYDRHVSLGFNYRMSELCAAVILAQVERAYDLVECRIKAAKLFTDVLKDNKLLKIQFVDNNRTNSYWCFSTVLQTDKPEVDWYKFRDLFIKNGGDGFYAAWKLSYFEPLFQNNVKFKSEVWQNYEKGLCHNAEFLQPRMIQFKTNYWNIDDARKQSEILYNTINQF